MSGCFHDITEVEERITSAYHPQLNDLVERQNRTMKNALVKVMDAHPEKWLHITESVLFAHRVSQLASTKYLPFFLIYNRDPVFPINVKFTLAEGEVNETVFAEETFEAILGSATRIGGEIHESATSNIRKAPNKQKKTLIEVFFPEAKLSERYYLIM